MQDLPVVLESGFLLSVTNINKFVPHSSKKTPHYLDMTFLKHVQLKKSFAFWL